MPLYEYSCSTCGDFEVWLRLAELSNPVHCNTCQSVSRRIYSAPNISLNSGSLSAIGKRGSEKPQWVKREKLEPKKPMLNRPTGRPWMISHTPERL